MSNMFLQVTPSFHGYHHFGLIRSKAVVDVGMYPISNSDELGILHDTVLVLAWCGLPKYKPASTAMVHAELALETVLWFLLARQFQY